MFIYLIKLLLTNKYQHFIDCINMSAKSILNFNNLAVIIGPKPAAIPSMRG